MKKLLEKLLFIFQVYNILSGTVYIIIVISFKVNSNQAKITNRLTMVSFGRFPFEEESVITGMFIDPSGQAPY